MSTKLQAELSLENEKGQDVVAYPFIEAEHVTLANGMNIETMLAQDVSMPTVTHENLNFKVGVGDQDVSSAIVDSSVAEMTIKGQTYQNILPEPSTHVLSNNEEMFKVNEGLDPIVEIVDGVSRSAVLKGQTLVNLLERFHHGCSYDSETGIYTSTQNEWVEPVRTTQNVKVNVPYTLFAKVNTTSDYIYIRLDYNDGTIAKDSIINGHVTPNSDIFIKTTVVFSKEDRIRFVLRNAHDGVVKMSNIMLIEGDHTNQDIPYFEGMASCKMPILYTIGKNLLPPVKNTWYPCRFKQGTTFKLSTKDSVPSNGGNVVFKDINGTSVWFGIDSGNTTSTKVLPCDVYYISNSLATGVEHQLEIGKQVTSYEPYKTNILRTPEEVILRSLPNGVKDTLNLNTGEYVQRIGEITFKNQTAWEVAGGYPNLYYYNTNDIGNANIYVGSGVIPNLYCDKMAVTSYSGLQQSTSGVKISNRGKEGTHSIAVYNSDITNNVVDFKAWLTQNPFTVQYELATPVVKTVDLSSSGNWEKVVLDGSESGWTNSYSAWNNKVFCLNNSYLPNVIKPASIYDTSIMCDKLRAYTIQWLCEELGRTGVALHNWSNGYLQIAINGVDTVDKLKQYLSQNPVTVWYQTTTHQDSTQVKQPIFFKDGHIIQSSGADNSLIPTLDYQAKTSNSYVMDLMKANTRYTMKAKSASGTFTIDGTSYGAGTNGTFTTPSSMTNKFLVMSNNANEEVMILEGDVTDKTIPYFKGIKSAFEGEDEIEISSTGKNLYPYGDVSFTPTDYNWHDAVGTVKMYGDIGSKSKCRFPLKKGTYYFSHGVSENIEASQLVDDDENLLFKSWSGAFTLTEDAYLTLRIKPRQDTYTEPVLLTNIQITEKTVATAYEPYKSNNTKFSLSCGVNEVSEPLAISTEFGRWAVDTGASEATNETRRSIRAISIPENTSEICFYNNDVLRAVNFHALDENENYVEYIHSADGRVAIKDGYKKFKIHLGTNNSSNLSCRFTTINNKALRSLPNGVCDEIILDRENNKAKIIQRVGKVTYDGADVWGTYTVHQNNVRIQTVIPNCVRRDTAGFIYAICDKLPSVIWNYSWLQNYNLVTVNHANIHLQLSDTTMTKQQMLSWLTQNPITVQYELAEPVVTEVDLSGFPYIYKDGHIFLNGEITPVTEITYSINQEHQIEANNQDLIRHEQDIDFLYKLIKQYVIVDFQSTYLSLRNQ